MKEHAQPIELEEDARIRKSLALLKDSPTPEARFTVLQEVVQYWHGTIGTGDGIPDEELKGLLLPEPLRRWYRWAGNRTEIMSGQNFLFSPRESEYPFRKLRVEDDRLLFQIENQGVYEWATLPAGVDPPVFGRYDGDPWKTESVSLAEHLILTCLFEAILCHAACSASSAWLTSDQLSQITNGMMLVPIPSWLWPGLTRFYVGGGAFMCATECQEPGEVGFSIWIGGRRPQSLKFLESHVDETWEHIHLT